MKCGLIFSFESFMREERCSKIQYLTIFKSIFSIFKTVYPANQGSGTDSIWLWFSGSFRDIFGGSTLKFGLIFIFGSFMREERCSKIQYLTIFKIIFSIFKTVYPASQGSGTDSIGYLAALGVI